MARSITFKQLQKELESDIDKIANDKALLRNVADDLAQAIRVRVRKGFGVSKYKGRKKQFAPLKPSTIKRREYLKKKGELLSGVGAAKSRLTESGQMTDAIQGDSKKGQIIIRLDDKRDDGVSNSELEKGHRTGRLGRNKATPRPFLEVSDTEYNNAIKDLRREIKKAIKRI